MHICPYYVVVKKSLKNQSEENYQLKIELAQQVKLLKEKEICRLESKTDNLAANGKT